jgi:Family of unknown function (DUF6455)
MEWPMYRNVERRAVRLQEMMRRLQANPAHLMRTANGECYMEARQKCVTCLSAEECLVWLDSEPDVVGEADFCPNREMFISARKEI